MEVHKEDFKDALFGNGEAIVGLLERIIKEDGNIPQDIRLTAATIAGNIGLMIVPQELVAEAIAFPEKAYLKPEKAIYLEDEPSDYEQVLQIINSGDVDPSELDPPTVEPLPEGTPVDG